MNPPLVSVVLPTYNAAKFLSSAIESILNQTYKNVELIVVDDGSTDSTMDILKKYTGRIKCLYQNNSGPNAARNTGILAAKGKLIAYQDADDVSLPTRIEEQVKFLLNNPEKSMVHTGMTNINSDGVREPRLGRIGTTFELLQNNFVHNGTVMHWKYVFDTIGMWDRTGDWGLYVRMSEKFEIGCIIDCLYNRNLHGDNISKTCRRLNDRLITLEMFKDRYDRKREMWMAFKIKRISLECKMFNKISFKNKRSEIIFWHIVQKVSNGLEEIFYRIECNIWRSQS